MNAAYRRVVDALERHDCHPRGTAARCPAHDDRAPSLSVRQAEQFSGVLVHCHAGCRTEDVLAALGLTTQDLFDEPRQSAAGYAVVAEYPYVDEHGEVLFLKERREPKDFRIKTPDGRYGKNGARAVLYRLPEVLAAVADGRPVYVVEGEKDADALARLGHAATTNFEGAAKPGQRPKWRPQYGDVLRGADVIVIADRDDAGAAHADAVRADLTGKAKSVTVRQAAEGKDVSDHLAAGRGVDELEPVRSDPPKADASPVQPQGVRRVRLRAASTFTPRPVHWCWENRVPRGELSLLAGREGIGKSTVAYTLVAQLSRGTLPGDCYGTPRAVFVAATEDSWEHTIVPRLMAAGADLDRVFCVDVTTSEDVDTGLSLPRDLPGLERAMTEQGATLLLLDPLMSRLSESLDTHKDADVRLGLEPVVRIAQRTGAAVLGIIHVNKSGGTDPLNTVMGSRAFSAVARAVLFVMVDPDDEAVRLLGVPKSNSLADGPADLGLLHRQREGRRHRRR